MSDFQKQLLHKNNLKVSKCPKLIPHLFEHKNYCIHYRNLQLVEKLGVKIGEIYNVISFNQKPWMKESIDFDIHKRKYLKTNLRKISSN